MGRLSEAAERYAGGCLCGAVRYEAEGAPLASGLCYCADCRKSSGAGFIPFMLFRSDAVRISGRTLQYRSPSLRGEAVRNSCAVCGGLVFGGEVGKDTSHTIYAGSLDDASLFHPTMAIFARDRASWTVMPPGLREFETVPD